MKRLLLLLMVALSGAFTAMADDYAELLTNGACDGTFNGWEKINGGDGWAIGQDDDGSSYWASSYHKCTLSQTIVLSEKNFSNEDIDAGNVVCIASAMIKAIWDPKNYGRASTVAIVRVEMLDDSNNVLSTVTVLDDNSIFLEWTLFETDEFVLVSGTRKLKFIVEGQDSAYWGGQFGPCFKNLSLQARVGTLCIHEWVENITSEATCTADGSLTRTCQLCGAVVTEIIPALGHDWGEWTVLEEPTCTGYGSSSHTCQRCGEVENQQVEPLGHDWNTLGKCDRCGMSRAFFDGVRLLDYIESTGQQAFNTGYIHKNNTIIEMDCNVKKNQDRRYEAVFGARLGTYKNNAYCFFSRFNGLDIPCYNRSGKETTGENDFVYDERILLWASYDNVCWFRESNPLQEVGSIYTNGTSDDGKTPMFLFNLNTANTEGGVQADTSPCSMKLYSCKIHEDGDLIHNYVPAKKNGVVGLYDLATGAFSGSITQTPFLAAAETLYNITLGWAGLTIDYDCPGTATEGKSVTLNLTYTNKKTPSVEVKDENGNLVSIERVKTGTYSESITFTMPASDVNIIIITEPEIIYDIPDDCEVRNYARDNSIIYDRGAGYGYTIGNVTGKMAIAFAPDGTVYLQDPAWYIDNEHVWVKGTYDEATGAISIPTGQFLTWYNETSYYGHQLMWGSTAAYLNEEDQLYYLRSTPDPTVETIEFRIDGDDLYLLNSQGNINAEFPDCYNSTGMYLMWSDDFTMLSTEFASVDEDGNQLPFATLWNIIPAIPADPTIQWYDSGDESGYSKIMFTMPKVDINGNKLDPDLLSYSIFLDNGRGAELFTFEASVYPTLDEDLTEIPYTLQGYDFYAATVYFYRTNAEGYETFFTNRIGMQVYYTVNGVRNQSNIVWVDNPDGINEIKADQSDNDDKIYNLAGQRLGKMQKGVNIINGKKILK